MCVSADDDSKESKQDCAIHTFKVQSLLIMGEIPFDYIGGLKYEQ